MKRKIICLSAILTFAFSVTAFANDFKDISSSDVKTTIEYFSEEGYIDILKDSSNMLYPQKEITRGEFAIIFQEMLGIVPNDSSKELPFTDINNLNKNQLAFVQSAYDTGIIIGKPVNQKLTFGYNDKLTKEEMVTIIGRYLDLSSEIEISFKDADEVSQWAKVYVSYFYDNGFTKLDQNGYFNPKEIVTREEAIKVLFEVDKYIKTQVDNGLVVKNYIGNGNIGLKSDTYPNSSFTMITDIDFIGNDSLLITDSQANQFKVASSNKVNVLVGKQEIFDFAGLPIGGYVDGNNDVAVLNKPNKALVIDENIIIFTEEGSNAVRGYNIADKKVYTVSGHIESGYIEGNSTSALFNKPTGIARDSKGNLYIADTLNNVIRKIDVNMNTTLYAGSPSQYGNVVGDIKNARFNEPTDLFMVNDVLYVCDSGNNMIKKIENNKVSIVAGVDTYINEETQTQVGGDLDGNVSVAKFKYPTGIFVDGEVVYVADSENNKIKVVKDGVVTTIAGSGKYGNQLGNALQTTFDYPSAIVVKDKDIYVADKNNYTVKVITQK